MTEKFLTQNEINNIALGYRWNPSMSYEEFASTNSRRLPFSERYKMYQLIESRYIQKKYENQ